jgi:N-hydroxyarylamine O-acetyltransferase
MDITSFLRRIDYSRSTAPGEATLRALHRAFVTTVPFENLDIHLGRRILLDEHAFFKKIVLHRRGGFCYELNGLFAAILRELGFDVTLLSARVFDGNGDMGREFVHLVLMVSLERRWIADVGFGDWSSEPLCLDVETPQLVDGASFRITQDGERYLAEQADPANCGWKPRYSFTLTPRRLSEFAAICDDLQTADDSAFRRRRMCTRRTPEGRITLTDQKLIVTSNDQRREIALEGKEAYEKALVDHFGIILPAEQPRI